MTRRGNHLTLNPDLARAAPGIALFLLTLAWAIPSAAGVAAQGTPPGGGEYALRLVITLPPAMETRQVYVIFNNTISYALMSEGNGNYSLEAEAAATQSGAEVVLTNAGVEERRDRLTWTAYPGYKLTVEADYRQNLIGGLELGKVSQVAGTWAQVAAAPNPAANQTPPNPLTSNPPSTTASTDSSGNQLSTSDTAPTWLSSGTPTPPASGIISATNPGLASSATLTTTNANTVTQIAAASSRQATPETPGWGILLNPASVIGITVLLAAALTRKAPAIMRIIAGRHVEEDGGLAENETDATEGNEETDNDANEATANNANSWA